MKRIERGQEPPSYRALKKVRRRVPSSPFVGPSSPVESRRGPAENPAGSQSVPGRKTIDRNKEIIALRYADTGDDTDRRCGGVVTERAESSRVFFLSRLLLRALQYNGENPVSTCFTTRNIRATTYNNNRARYLCANAGVVCPGAATVDAKIFI